MSIIVPFNHQPSSISIKTSTFTIGNDEYARVTCTDFSTDFTIGGTVVVEQAIFEGNFDPSTGATTARFTNTSPYLLVGHISSANTGPGTSSVVGPSATTPLKNAYTGNTMSLVLGTTNVLEVTMVTDDRIYTSATSGTSTPVYYNLRAAHMPQNTTFWIPPGTQVSGARYILEIYDIIS